jgi:putative membrane protein
MKLSIKSRLTLFLPAAAILVLSSCSMKHKKEDTKVVATEHNSAKFNNTENENDAKFLVNAAEMYLEEVNLSQMAVQNSRNPDVIELARILEANQSLALIRLNELARSKSISVPVSTTNKAQDTRKDLYAKAGKDFDNAYCQLMVDRYKEAVASYEKATVERSDSDIKAWATNSLPGLRSNLDKSLVCQKKCEAL